MKKQILTYILLFFQGIWLGYGQVSDNGEVNSSEIPHENIFIHYNTTLLLSGEYLYYKVYCRNASSNGESLISKIAYVTLVGEDGASVFQHKIVLEAGSGQGDFFVPVSVKSGNYKLIGYTQWMKNKGIEHFFQGDISIINPYLSDQSAILKGANDTLQTQVKSKGSLFSDGETGTLSLKDSVLNTRNKVVLTLEGQSKSKIKGDYSLSVRKVDPFAVSPPISFKTFNPLILEKPEDTNDTFYIPEMRGDLISGMVKFNDKSLRRDAKVVVSIPGENAVTKVANIDGSGNFLINLDKPYDSNQAIFQVLDQEKDVFNITLDNNDLFDYSGLSFYNFSLTPQLEDELLKKSIHNQIENAFFSVKPDTLAITEPSRPAYLDKMQFYNLDEYTRFPTVQETLIEIVTNVFPRRIGKDNYRIQVLEAEAEFRTEEERINVERAAELESIEQKKADALITINEERAAMLNGLEFYRTNIFLVCKFFKVS
ncbi:hypothetical protein LCGC14_2084860 [marine sediment metagenome]|uniref:Macroglobulin domain-containing protein n=1 Tax=marine sediment metagenome TaxID=412755 RepID=A0A0F9EEC7_9ZZZZ